MTLLRQRRSDVAAPASSLGRQQGRPPTPLDELAALARPATCDLVSSDLFDTVLLRDRSTETVRLAEASRRAAPLLGLDPDAVVSLRWTMQTSVYRAVAVERPSGEATLARITATMATAFGLDREAAEVLRRTEVEVDASHLLPNRPLLEVLDAAQDAGVPVVAVSDTYYSEVDLRQLLAAVVGDHRFRAVYSSADLGATKHVGSIFPRVSELERVDPSRVLHVGDSGTADVRMAAAAGWTPVHLPRSTAYLRGRRIAALRALPLVLRRDR
ncbi:HAD family hydrolase [uncultured Friedmanniella sp.]|uniref:HAD family hydrolase n=1 Tax=uncultured Friedmanniella sp. TaxID=335381 RepID=UPI0035C9E640